MTLQGALVAGRYRVGAMLGAGGMATVYRALDVRLDRRVALKLMLPNLAADEVAARRFSREARALAAISHPAVVGIYDVGVHEGQPFIVMELVEGPSLADLLARDGPLAPDVGVPILRRVAEGLGALHQAGFVHRDVKPQNVLIGAAGAKLGDFGLAQNDTATSLTLAGSAIGTLSYLAPELIEGAEATPASDVYALGVVAYQTLTGQLPFPAGSLAALVAAHRQRPSAPSELGTWIHQAFDRPVLDCLRADPGARPDLSALSRGLDGALAAWERSGAPRPPRKPEPAVAGGAPLLHQGGTGAARVTGAGTISPALTAATAGVAGSSTARAAVWNPGGTTVRIPLPRAGGSAARLGSGLRAGLILGLLAVGLVSALWIGSSLGLFGGGGGAPLPPASATPTPSPPASPTPSASPTPTPTPSPTPSPTPTPPPTPAPTPSSAPTPDQFKAAIPSVTAYQQAVQQAPGLDPRTKGQLQTLSDHVLLALQEYDAPSALEYANWLYTATQDAAQRMKYQAGLDLLAAAQSVLQDCQQLPSPGAAGGGG